MSGGSRIIDLRPGPEASTDRRDGVVMRGGDPRPTMSDAVAEALPPDPPGLAGSDDDPLLVLDLAPEQSVIMTEDAARSSRAWLLPVFGAAVSAGWIAAMVWLAAPELRAASAIALSGFVAALCTPPALIGILLLLRLRTGAAEARRFASSAMSMREEAARLDLALLSMTRSLEISRGRITDQGIALEAIGERSIARLDGIGSGMAQQVGSARDHAATLAAAADAAQARLAELVDRLPRAHADTQQLAGLLDQAADRTSERVAGFAAQLGGLADAARQADTAAGDAARQLAAHIERMEATSAAAGARLEQITGSMATQIDAMLGQTARALDEARKGIAAQGDAMLAMLGTNQAALDHAGRDSAEMLADRVTAIEASVGRIGDRLLAQRDAGDAMVRDLDTGIGRVSGRLDALHAQGVDRTQSLAASISALGGSADAMTEALKVGEAMAGGAIVSTEHLLTALDAAAREIDETLPDALGRLDARITDSRRVVSAAKPELLALVTAAESTHDAIEAIAQVIGAQREAVDKMAATLLDALNAGKLKADALGQMVDETVGRTHRFAEEAAPRLVEAMLRVRDSATAAAERARETLGNVIPEAARAIEVASAEAMRHGAFAAFEQQLGAIGEAATAAAEAASDASERLTRQMLAITDSTAMVESKIEAARAEHENADRDSFARRVSLLIETLNSASIDIAKSFSTDVSDSAWAAYLKGDRGVFTRRAVRLLDTADSREIVRLYDQERPFREQVNRYIHDFEAMLRAVLAQRDGSSLGVTILSSDMGKLYVALAQAIERLRT